MDNNNKYFQDVNLLFAYAHRRYCSMLQRTSVEDMDLTKKMAILLDKQIPDASHDFDSISHEGCDYDTDKGISINVDKILGGGDDDLVSDSEYEQFYGDYTEEDAEVFDAPKKFTKRPPQ